MNELGRESSPYLLQHANNPVHWHAWHEDSLRKAKEEDKPVVLSIGYSTCHWCHVMARESFENEAIARLMNDYFVCIKVDREERPDVDQVYMDALHAMGLPGGWPLNVFLTPEQKPFYGGTYFPPAGWKALLLNIAEVFESKREQLEESAEKLTEALKSNTPAPLQEVYEFDSKTLERVNDGLMAGFDTKDGGMGHAPKFPMPAIWKYINQYLANEAHTALSKQLHLTLEKMALGGIYDQVGGGWARYSTDGQWFAPHFEKMLYDNGQLLSEYAKAYILQPRELYREVVYQTVGWLEREMLDENGAFYSALDADSGGQEGRFYVWTAQELKEALREDYDLVEAYYSVSELGNWEHGWNILHRRVDDAAFAQQHGLEPEKLKVIHAKLMDARSPRVRPALDDKILTAWNALMARGLLDAYDAFGEGKFLDLALANASFIIHELMADGKLLHAYGKSTQGFLDDYAMVIDLLIAAYQVTFNETYLSNAKELAEICLDEFHAPNDPFFFYTSRASERLIADKKEIHDNVIPASNSVIANSLLTLGKLLDERRYVDQAGSMAARVAALTEREPRYMANWAVLIHKVVCEPYEIVIVGEKAHEYRHELAKHRLPNHLFAGTKSNAALPLLRDRTAINNQTTIYVCRNKTCRLPVHTVKQALELMRMP